MISVLFNELSQFTIHGVSNIFRQKQSRTRLIWSVLMFISILLLIYHATILAQKLLKNEIVTSTKRTTFVKPDVVFCFYHPFDQLFMQYPVGPDADFMRNISQQINDKYSREDIMGFGFNKLLSYDTVGIRNIYKAFFQKHLLLTPYCNHNSIISYEFHYEFYACLRVSLLKCGYFRFVMNSLSVANYSSELYSGNSKHFFTELMSMTNAPLNPNSLAVYFMHGNHHANILQPDVIVNPGVYTTIELRKSVQHKHQNRNDFRCDEDNFDAFYNPLANITAQHGQHVKYSRSSVCRYRSVQLCMYSKFKCVVSSLPIPLSIPGNVPFCFDAASDYFDLGMKYNDYLTICQVNARKCARPCNTVTYEIKKREKAIDVSFDYSLKEYLQLVDRWTSNKSSLIPEFAEFKSNGTISDRFKQSCRELEITVKDDEDSEIIEESFAYSFGDLFADYGGILGLYLGCSILSIYEIFPLAHKMISYWKKKENLQKNRQQTFQDGDMTTGEEAQLAGSSECGSGHVNTVSVANTARLNELIATLEKADISRINERFALLESAVESLTMEISKICQSLAHLKSSAAVEK